MEVFQPLAEADFLNRVVEHLLKYHSDVIVDFPDYACLLEEIPKNVFEEMVSGGIARARSYGMEWESTLCSFLVLMFVAAPNFDEHPLIRRVLKDESVPPDSRIKMLWRHISDETWEAVGQNYDAQVWKIFLQENPDGAVIHPVSGAIFPPPATLTDIDEKPVCPECGEDVPVGVNAAVGAMISCVDCGASLTVMRLHPIELDPIQQDVPEGEGEEGDDQHIDELIADADTDKGAKPDAQPYHEVIDGVEDSEAESG